MTRVSLPSDVLAAPVQFKREKTFERDDGGGKALSIKSAVCIGKKAG